MNNKQTFYKHNTMKLKETQTDDLKLPSICNTISDIRKVIRNLQTNIDHNTGKYMAKKKDKQNI